MPHSEARAWWADVEHVRESIERRRADSAARPLHPRTGSADRAARPAPLSWEGESVKGAAPGTHDDVRGLAHTDAAARPSASASAAARRRTGGQADADRAAARGRGPHTDAERQRVRSRRATGEHAGPGADRRRGVDPLVAPDRAARPSGRHTGPRRTVQITGRPASASSVTRLVEVERRRPARGPAERFGTRPDRVALWAVLLAFFLILVAATSSHAATAPSAAAPAPTVLVAPAP
ncbi:MAG: hypothetical protein QOD44_3001 [Solirubrobacteraceae bacterium]|nr:hypothetical protein [Solirubrobacteraceae bacterium]